MYPGPGEPATSFISRSDPIHSQNYPEDSRIAGHRLSLTLHTAGCMIPRNSELQRICRARAILILE